MPKFNVKNFVKGQNRNFKVNTIMSYSYNYTNKIDQFGITNFNLKLSDPAGVLPDFSLPVIVRNSDLTEDLLRAIAENAISQKLQELSNSQSVSTE
jgi:hypothetical protein